MTGESDAEGAQRVDAVPAGGGQVRTDVAERWAPGRVRQPPEIRVAVLVTSGIIEHLRQAADNLVEIEG